MKKAILAVVLFVFVTQAMLLAQQVTVVNLYDLLSDWDNNKVRVKQNYHNKTIRTTGEASRINTNNSIELSIDSGTLLSLSFFAILGMYPDTTYIRVNFASSERTKLANLNKDQSVTVRGVYDGDRNVINNAVIETTPTATAPAPAPAPAARTTPTPAPAPATQPSQPQQNPQIAAYYGTWIRSDGKKLTVTNNEFRIDGGLTFAIDSWTAVNHPNGAYPGYRLNGRNTWHSRDYNYVRNTVYVYIYSSGQGIFWSSSPDAATWAYIKQ